MSTTREWDDHATVEDGDACIASTHELDELKDETKEDTTTYTDESNGPRVDITAAPKTQPHIPNGGLRAWLVILASACATFSTFGLITAWGVFQDYYERTLLSDKSPSTIAWIGSLQYSLLFMTGLPMGRIFDLGYHRLPIGIASACLVTATFLVAECTEYYQFLLCQGFAVGLSSGLVMGPSVSVVSQWFTTKKGIAFAFASLGSSLGGVIFPIVARRLIPVVGFQWTMRTLGFLQLAVLGITNAFTRRNLPGKPLRPLTLRHFKNTAFTVYCIAGFILFLGLYTVLTYIDPSARTDGLPDDFSFYLVSIANAGSTVGRISGGLISDKIGPLNVMIPATAIAGICTYAWPFAKTKGSLTVIALIYGAGSGVFVALFGAPLVAMGELAEYGTRMGILLTTVAFGALVGTPISGAIQEHTGGFKMVGVYAGTVLVASAAMTVVVRYFVLRKLWGKA